MKTPALPHMPMALGSPDAIRSSDASTATEEVFARLLVREVRRAMPEGGMLGDGPFSVLEDVLDDALADALVRDGGLRRRATSQRAGDAFRAHATGHAHPPAPTPSRQPLNRVIASGRLTGRFGRRRDPIDGHVGHHHGVDIAARRGTPIRAPKAGRVLESVATKGYGNLIIIDHGNGLQTRYAHCDRLDVAKGDWVTAGQGIGTVGSSGRSTGPHLHFEVRQDGKAIDPLANGWRDKLVP